MSGINAQYHCWYCLTKFSCISNVIFHLKKRHFIVEKSGLFQFKCLRATECPKTFDTFKSMQHHSRRCHRKYNAKVDQEIDVLLQNIDNDIPTIETQSDKEAIKEKSILANESKNDLSSSQTLNIKMLNDLKNERNNFEKFNFSNNEIFRSFLYSLLNFKISRRLLIAIFASLDLLILSLKEVLLNYLSSQIKNFETSEVCELINLFFINLNHNLKPYTSTYFLRKYFNERNDRFVAPIPKVIGGRWDKVYNKVKNRYEEIYKTCEFYYVPIKETILQLFKIPTFCEAFFNRDHECIEGVHQKFCCGKVYQKNDFHRNNEHTIRLQLYYDDFTLTNSKNNKTIKLGAVYLQLENLPSFFTSHIDNIHLVALFHTVDLQK